MSVNVTLVLVCCEQQVFLNVPFDKRYQKLLDALVFAVHDCGFVARCALEQDDSGEIRIEKIYSIIAACRFGIQDLSRTTLDSRFHLPRFNMPFCKGLTLVTDEHANELIF